MSLLNVITVNQHFAYTFSMQIFKFQRRSCKLSSLSPPRRQNATENLLAAGLAAQGTTTATAVKTSLFNKKSTCILSHFFAIITSRLFLQMQVNSSRKKVRLRLFTSSVKRKIMHFTSWLCSNGKERFIKLTARYACKVVDLLIKLLDWSNTQKIIAGRIVQNVLRTPVYI